MKILIATGIYPPEIGGPATYAFLVRGEFEKRGHEVKILPFRVVRKYPTVIRHILYFLKVLKLVFWAEIVLAQDTVSVGLPSVLAAKILRKPIIIRVPGDFAWEQGVQRFGVKEGIDDFQKNKYGFRVEILRKIQKFVVRKSNKVIVPSDYFKSVVLSWGVKPENLIRIYNGVSVPENTEPKYFSEKTIVTSGRLVPWKGFDVLINSISKINAKLIIIGDGDDKKRLESLILEKNLDEKVSLIGSLNRKDLMSFISGADIFVLPSTFESFSFQLVEAMMLGSVVVALNAGNISEIIENGKNGILVEKNNTENLSVILNDLLSDKNKRERLSLFAKEDSKRFSLEKTVDQLENLFKKLI